MSIFQSRRVNKKLDAVFAGRPPLDDEHFYDKYFRSHGMPPEIVGKVRRILEEEFDVDLSRLAATDDVARNLSFIVDYGSLDAVEVVIRLEDEFGIAITDTEAAQTTTVYGIVNLVWDKLRQSGA